MKHPRRVGIIGAGWPGQQHARAAHTAGAIVAAVAEPNEKRAAEFAAALSSATIYSDYAELLGDRKVDAGAICLPIFLHFPASLRVLEQGKHVLCEKPPTISDAEMIVLKKTAETRGLVYFSAGNFVSRRRCSALAS